MSYRRPGFGGGPPARPGFGGGPPARPGFGGPPPRPGFGGGHPPTTTNSPAFFNPNTGSSSAPVHARPGPFTNGPRPPVNGFSKMTLNTNRAFSSAPPTASIPPPRGGMGVPRGPPPSMMTGPSLATPATNAASPFNHGISGYSRGPGASTYAGPPRGPPTGSTYGRAPGAPPTATGNRTMMTSTPPPRGMGGMSGYPGMSGPGATVAAPAAPPVEIDQSKQASARFMRMTTGSVPKTRAMAQQLKLPLGCVVTPLAESPSDIPLINYGASGVIRCKKCRTYINPFVDFLDGGRRWKCNICAYLNDVPHQYFSPVDGEGRREDLFERPELLKGEVEIIAPAEYMVRPPQAAAFLFVIDVSYTAVQSGMLYVTCKTIKSILDKLPGAPRTHIGFVTFNSSVHFYNLKSSMNQPQMLVMPDTQEPFLPAPDDLLVNLKESRGLVDALLDQLPTMFEKTNDVEVALGPALQCGFKVMHHIGGKMCVMLSSLPSTGAGRLKHRDSPKIYGTPQEHKLFTPQESFYRARALEMSRQQISVDLFLCPQKYVDVATLSMLPKHTSGELYFYPGFHPSSHGEKMSVELSQTLTRQTGFEAVMRVRCSKGMKVSQFHGNFFIRGTDLLALPNVTPQSTFTVELEHESEAIGRPVLYVQSALLYTTSTGERRIRVNTIAASVATRAEDIVKKVDMDAVCNVIAKKAALIVVKSGAAQARKACEETCVSILRGSRPAAAFSQGLQDIAPSLQLLALYLQSLQKNCMLRGGAEVSADQRAFLLHRVSGMAVPTTRVNIFPRMYALHSMPKDAGLPAKEGQTGESSKNIVMPPFMHLAASQISDQGVYLLEDGLGIYILLGRKAPKVAAVSLFGSESVEGKNPAQQWRLIRRPNDSMNARINAICDAIREGRELYQRVHVVVQGGQNERYFQMRLVEDRAPFTGGQRSYQEFASNMQKLTKLKIPH